jgi:hypothetical protein
MNTAGKILTWIARIICIVTIIFISLFAFDAISPNQTFWQNAGALLISLLPSFVLIAILVIAWKWKVAGGIILILTGIGLGVFIFNLNYNQRHFTLVQSLRNVLLFCLPFVIAGILFILSHFIGERRLVRGEG